VEAIAVEVITLETVAVEAVALEAAVEVVRSGVYSSERQKQWRPQQ